MIQVDNTLIKRCQKRDKSAFAELFEIIGRDIYGLAYSILRNHDDVDEVLQETYIRIYRYIGKLKEIEKFHSWVKRIVINQCFTIHKKRSRDHYEIFETEENKIEETAWSNHSLDNPRTALMRKDMIETIDKAINALPPRQQIAVTLFDVQGFSLKEVAEILNCSEGAIKFNIHQGREKLKRMLKKYSPKKTKLNDESKVSS